MQTNWIATTEALPKDDEAVSFLTGWHALEQNDPILNRQATLA